MSHNVAQTQPTVPTTTHQPPWRLVPAESMMCIASVRGVMDDTWKQDFFCFVASLPLRLPALNPEDDE